MGTTTPALVLATLLCVHLAIAFRIETGAETSGSVGSQHPAFVEVNSVNSEGTLGEDEEEGVKIKSVIPVLKQGLQQVGG